MGQFDASPEYWLEARAVRVASSQPHTTVRLALDETGGTVVAPLSGMVRVTNSRGVPVGELVKGSAVRFAGQAEAPSRVSVSGCLYAQGDRFGLTDAVTNVPIRLTGQGLQQEIGHVVDVSGVEGAAAADGLNVSVTAVRRLTSGPCVSGAAAGNAGLLAMAKPAEMTEQLQAAAPRLSLLVLEGEGAINNIKQRTAREPIVEVQDENHRPVAGAFTRTRLPDGRAATGCGSAPSGRRSTPGRSLRAPWGLDALADADTIIVPGTADPAAPLPPAVVDALRAAAATGPGSPRSAPARSSSPRPACSTGCARPRTGSPPASSPRRYPGRHGRSRTSSTSTTARSSPRRAPPPAWTCACT